MKWTEDYDENNDSLPEPNEKLPPGTDLPRRDWVALNRARSKVAKTGENLVRWGFSDDAHCICGEPNQTLMHLLHNCPAGPECSEEDLRDANEIARRWIERWRETL